MFRIDSITKDWKEAGAFMAQVNLYGFWDEHCFLTKSGDLGCALKIGGIDAESLDHAGRDYVVKHLEAALRSLVEKTRLYQILFRHNCLEIPHAEYENPLVRTAVEQRADFLAAKADRLYSIEIFWIVMVDGIYAKTGLLHALAALPKQPRSSLGIFGRDLRALFSSSKERTLLHAQIERDRLRLQQKVQSLSGQLASRACSAEPNARCASFGSRPEAMASSMCDCNSSSISRFKRSPNKAFEIRDHKDMSYLPENPIDC